MDKNALKKFAVMARLKLINDIRVKAAEFGIVKQNHYVLPDSISIINNKVLSEKQQKQYQKLIQRLQNETYDELINEVAYTWFNRITALRFMEINDYLPTRTRILSSLKPGKREPDVVTNITDYIEELNLDRDEIYRLIDHHQDDDLFKLVLIAQSRQLEDIIPHVFSDITAEVELLLPNNLLQSNHVVSDLIEMIPEVNFRNIEIIGWLYQFYISERKGEVFSNGGKISKDDIPAATQIFTPKWIVEYLVNNSLGRLWLEHHPKSSLREQLNYYLDNNERVSSDVLDPEKIRLMDPSCGSGHMLIHAFDVLYLIYLEQGYTHQEIPKLILENNLYGLDIDSRAAQLATFALVMKARSYDRGLFDRHLKLHIQSIEKPYSFMDLPDNLDHYANGPLTELIHQLNRQFVNATDLGSIIKLEHIDVNKMLNLLNNVENSNRNDLFTSNFLTRAFPHIRKLILQYQLLSQHYDVVVTNPPYMGHRKMDSILDNYTKKYYQNSKTDLFAVFIEVCLRLTKPDRYMAMINQHSWMFLSSFEKLRKALLQHQTIINMVHLGARAFAETSGEVVQSTMFIMKKGIVPKFKAQYIRLVDIKDPEKKQIGFNNNHNYFETGQEGFVDIPGSPIAYWASNQIRKIFRENPKLGEIAQPKQGLATADNKRFLRQWYEVNHYKIKFDAQNLIDAQNSHKKWFPYNKGGAYRRWYGNYDYVVNWENNGYEIRNIIGRNGKIRSRPQNDSVYFHKSITWSNITSSVMSMRYRKSGSIHDVAGMSLFFENINTTKIMDYLLGLLNSNTAGKLVKIMNPTLNTQIGNIASFPIKIFINPRIIERVQQNIYLSKTDWDAFETSWNFQRHPFLQYKTDSGLITDAFKNWETVAQERFEKLKVNEEELNRQFIDIYGLQNELSSEETDKEVTVRKADQGRDVRSFLSYLVGILFGRYSLDEPGVIYAGGEFNLGRYQTFKPDPDNIIPIGFAKGYYEDDVVTRIEQLLKLIYGEDHFVDNMTFIAKSLYPKKTLTPEDALRRYFLRDFYKDHVKIYRKRPIYWELSSGKQDGFKALIYLHRYTPTLLAQIRTNYLLPLMRTISRLRELINPEIDSSREKAKAEKQRLQYQRQLTELRQYESVIQYLANQEVKLDLDDGVKVNYARFQNINVPSVDGTKTIKLNVLTKVKL